MTSLWWFRIGHCNIQHCLKPPLFFADVLGRLRPEGAVVHDLGARLLRRGAGRSGRRDPLADRPPTGPGGNPMCFARPTQSKPPSTPAATPMTHENNPKLDTCVLTCSRCQRCLQELTARVILTRRRAWPRVSWPPCSRARTSRSACACPQRCLRAPVRSISFITHCLHSALMVCALRRTDLLT